MALRPVTVKPVLRRHSKKDQNTRFSRPTMMVKSIVECSQGSVLDQFDVSHWAEVGDTKLADFNFTSSTGVKTYWKID